MSDKTKPSCETTFSLDPETRRRAAAVLEVLGGVRTPGEAAEALALSLPRYYQLEGRALDALIAACAPRVPGRSSDGRTLLAIQRENERLRQDLTRSQALIRATQRAAGMSEQDSTKDERPKNRKPKARALRAARRLGKPESPAASPATPPVQPENSNRKEDS